MALRASCRRLASSSTAATAALAQQSSQQLPSHARVVIVGGGVIGCSIAYHLGLAGWSDVVVLERSRLTSGTTWHAAGLISTFGSKSRTSTEFRLYTRDLYARLEAETGQSTGFSPVGFIEIAANKDRMEEFRRVAAFNRHCGIDVHEISPAEVAQRFPLCRTDDIYGGFLVEGDGRVNPVDVTMALAKGARMRGVRFFEGTAVASVQQEGGRVTGVLTAGGHVLRADVVVNAAGMWARQFGELAGVSIPNQAAEHYYLLTDPIPGVDPGWPVIEDPAAYTYVRPEGGGLMVGLFEGTAAPWPRAAGRIPDDFAFGEIEPDWERLAPFLAAAMARVPAAEAAGVKKLFCGPESFTPDLAPIIGEAPELRGYFAACGLNSVGILTGGGVGRLLAHWIVHGRPDQDVTGVNIDRFHAFHATPAYRRSRVVEALGMTYRPHYPTFAWQTARDVKRLPLHAQHVAARARFRDVSGWEAPDWFAPPGAEAGSPATDALSWGRHFWFDYWAAEHAAVRGGVGLIDMSFMSKFLVVGRDAGTLLDRLSTAAVDGPPGRITYTQWLDDDGRLQADVTVAKLAPERFLVVATDTAHRHVEAWLGRHTPPDAHVWTTDVSGALAQLNVQGPRSRALLAAALDADSGGGSDRSGEDVMSDAAFPFRGVRELAIGCARVTAVRVTYVGELGYELYVPTEQAAHVHERLLAAGAPLGLARVGLKALSSLRLEKGYRDYGHDMDNCDSLAEVGLAFTAAWDKPGGFIGRDAALAQRTAGAAALPCRLVQLLVADPAPLLFHAEVVWRDGVRAGDVRSGSYGHTLGGAVGLAMVRAQEGRPGGGWGAQAMAESRWEVDIAGVRYPARASLRPLYDADNVRIRG